MPNIGDTVKVTTTTTTEEGVLMPSSDDNTTILKLSTGYNVGFEKDTVKEIQLIKEKEESQTQSQEVPNNPNLPTIAILHTGGTIASKVDYKTGAAVSKFSPEDLVSMYPEITDIANIESELIAQMWSDDLRFPHFAIMAESIKRMVGKGVKGIIIGMGTDNLAVASAALSFIIEQSPVPILFVGSQRSSDRGGADAGMNLICAARFLVETDFAGVGICMHGSGNDDRCHILPGTKTYKLHTSRRDAFQAINTTPIAMVDYKTQTIEYLHKDYPKRKETLIIKPNMEDKVGLLKISIHMVPEQFEVFKGYKGLVIEGTGLGHAPVGFETVGSELHTKIHEALDELVKSGCVVVMASQCLFGGTNVYVYTNGRRIDKLGIIPLKDMLANTALVKLSWLLANYSMEDVKKLMPTNMRGEINERLEFTEEFI